MQNMCFPLKTLYLFPVTIPCGMVRRAQLMCLVLLILCVFVCACVFLDVSVAFAILSRLVCCLVAMCVKCVPPGLWSCSASSPWIRRHLCPHLFIHPDLTLNYFIPMVCVLGPLYMCLFVQAARVLFRSANRVGLKFICFSLFP